MDTPICDFVRRYAAAGGLRMHMPGHKGAGPLGFESLDITEIAGADELYRARGVIRQSEENAARLFGAGRTLYSAEGASLCIRAMLFLALLRAREAGLPARLLAARNAHRTLMTAAALLDIEIDWLFPAPEEGLLSCAVSPAALRQALGKQEYMGVYLTSPDYLGHLQDISALSAVCREAGVPLLVDNAHGAYLRFLPEDRHPLQFGADLCCDSAHKTLPCLTGAAYLHIGKEAPAVFSAQAEAALSMFASTSPSYLILQSLDAVNPLLAEDTYRARLAETAARLAALRQRLAAAGYALMGEEPMKLTVAPKPRGYTGNSLHDFLRARGIECEFSDPDHLVLMPSVHTSAADLDRLEAALLSAPVLPAIPAAPPSLPSPQRACGIREAMLRPRQEVPLRQALGRVLADAHMGCPPAVPILTAGEVVSRDALACMEYYGWESCSVLLESKKG